MSGSKHAAQGASLPFNHHLHPFLTFLKHERGFADATIVNRKRSLNPFLGWLVAQDVPLSTVSPVTITNYFTSVVAGRWKRTTISFHVYSLRSFPTRQLLQFCALGLGLLQNGDIAVGIFPEGKEILVGGFRFSPIT
jgi:hypothetical protein